VRGRLALFILAIIAAGSLATARSYTVKTGDTLYSIAQQNGLTLARLLMLNPGVDGISLKPGQVLALPDAAPAKTTAPATSTNNKPGTAAVVRVLGNTSVVRAAYSKVGRPYVWGASGPRAFDCSGFTRYVMKQFGVDLPHSSRLQARMGRFVSRNNLQPGDLVFFATRGAGISHVGLYVGNGKMVHASTPSTGVIVSSLSERYYATRYVGARRVL
jgi:cell wall-associated NlpC family hydrolase